MPSIHRKIVEARNETSSKRLYENCDLCYFCPYGCTNYSSPPPPPPPPTTSHHQFPTVLILMICGLGVVFLLFSYLTFVGYRKITRRNPRRIMNQSPVLGNDGLSENQEPVMDHHIWYIRTVGLPQSLIDSIPMFDYRRGEKIMNQGRSDNCPVCLSEFQENESLRLLPKCGHAFHVLCIDTWLRSHKNCPVCRSPVSINTNTVHASVANSIVNMGSADHSGSGQMPEFETDGTGAAQGNGGRSRIVLEKMASDLGDRRAPEIDPERVRRSVSMDYSYSSDSVPLVEMIHANKLDEGCSDTS